LRANESNCNLLVYARDRSIYHCRDKSCDIRIVNKEVSRRHLELYVNDDGNVCVLSLGREPVLINSEQVLSPRVLQSGDKIEVLLEGRTREFFFQANVEKTVVPEERGSLGSPLVASSIANRAQGAPEAIPAGDQDVAVPRVEEAENKVFHTSPPAERAPPDAISEAVSTLVREVLDRVVQSVDAAAAAIMTPIGSTQKRKSVRFIAKTPEGDARDATMKIRCIPKDGQPGVTIDDNTVALSEWGFKTMNKEEDAIDMETKLGDDASQQGTPASVKERVAGQPFKAATPRGEIGFEAVHTSAISQVTPGVAPAPATTPVTAAKPMFNMGQGRDEVDFRVLAEKLAEIANEHDVQFELPPDFMRFTPLPLSSKRKSLGGALSSMSIARASKRLSICSTSKDGSIEYDLPKDFMRFTPMVQSALKNVEETMTAVGGIHESPDDDAEEIATLRSVGHAVHDLADALDQAASVKRSVRAKTPGVKISIIEKGSTFKTSNPQVKVLFGGENFDDLATPHDSGEISARAAEVIEDTEVIEAADLDFKKNEIVGKDPCLADQSRLRQGELVQRLRSALAQARSYKRQALVLGKHLKRSSNKLSKARAAAKVLSFKHRAEKSKRIELQNTMKRLIEAREAHEAQHGSDELYNNEEEETDDYSTKVVVVGYNEAPVASCIEMAGEVAVVRPSNAPNTAVTPPCPGSRVRSRRSSMLKSVKRISLDSNKVRLTVDDIEVPQWVFEEEEAEDSEDQTRQDNHDDDEDTALDSLKESIEVPLPDDPDNDEEEANNDSCFVCSIGDDGDVLLLCDSCDNACHLACCKPPRKTVPKGDWFCAECKSKSKKRKAVTGKASKENVSTKKSTNAKKAKPAEKPATRAAPTRASRRVRS
jgi:hypothetical protein